MSVGSSLGSLQGPLRVVFISYDGREEAGIDGGGLSKELLEVTIQEIINPDRGIFKHTESHGYLYPSPVSEMNDESFSLFALSGALIGKALYEGILLQVPLAPFFISRIQGFLPTIDDLQQLDPEIHKNLIMIKSYNNDILNNLGLYFTIETELLGKTEEEELVPGGAKIQVTEANKISYVQHVADWHLRRRIRNKSIDAFIKGFTSILPIEWLRIFSPQEVNNLLGGGEGGALNVEDWRQHCVYTGGYTNHSRTIKIFWKVMRSLTSDQARAVLRFATSLTAAPLGGMAHLNPPFTIQRVDTDSAGTFSLKSYFTGGDTSKDRLPSASTCSNTLKLPAYKRESVLRKKLLYAITSDAGFELS